MKKIDLGSYRVLEEYKEKFTKFAMRYPRRHASLIKCVNVTGDNAINSKNCHFCFDLYGGVEDSKYAIHAVDLKDSHDGYGLGVGAELLYEGVDNGIHGAQNRFAVFTHTCRNVSYTYACHNSANMFGCVGLRNKEYCILNRQYSKEEYEMLVPKIIEHMTAMPYRDVRGRTYGFGEFFPPELSPFAYNETIAQEYFPLTADTAQNQGYRWKETEKKDYKITKEAHDLPDHIRDVPDTIMNDIIGCTHEGTCTHQCTSAFKIIPDELHFYREMNFPLPRLCPNCRHYARIAKRNPYRLWHRKCECFGARSNNTFYINAAKHFHGSSPCPNEFETSYAPDRPEIVYCEACYQNEIQ